MEDSPAETPFSPEQLAWLAEKYRGPGFSDSSAPWEHQPQRLPQPLGTQLSLPPRAVVSKYLAPGVGGTRLAADEEETGLIERPTGCKATLRCSLWKS